MLVRTGFLTNMVGAHRSMTNPTRATSGITNFRPLLVVHCFLLAIVFVACGVSSNPNIEATVEARVQATLTARPTPGPMFTPSQAIAVVQQYLRTKTWVWISHPSQGLPQSSEVRQCQVLEAAEWRSVHQKGTWVVTREMDWGAHYAALKEQLGISNLRHDTGTQIDEWALDEHTRLVKRLGPESTFAYRKDC